MEVIHFPTVEYIYTLCFKRGNHDRFQPHFGCHKVTKDSIPLMLIRNPSFFSQGWNCYLSPQLVPLTSQLGDNGSTVIGPPPSWSQHAFENRWPFLGAHWNKHAPHASLSPSLPTRHPLVSGPRAGDKVIFAVLENKLGIYKRKRKHTKCIFLPKYVLSVLRFGGA